MPLMDGLKKIWHDPVWSKVIGGLILAAVLGAAFRSFLKRAFAAVWGFLLGATPVANWVLGLLIVIVVVAVAIVVLIVRIVRRERNRPATADWMSYTTDVFFGLRWRWGYGNGAIQNLYTFCPQCDYQVFPDNPYSWSADVRFDCDSCKRTVAVVRQSWPSLVSVVTRLIQQKLRGENRLEGGDLR